MAAAHEKSSQPGLHVLEGDHLYFSHPEHGVLSGKVGAVGKDGVTIAHETAPDGYHKVRWDKVLGHKERRARRLVLLEQGEDGAIAEDETGKRVFVRGSLPLSEDEAESAGDHVTDNVETLGKSFSPPGQPILVDIGHLHGPACDHALEGLFKAISDEDGIAFDIWQVHENPFIRELVERFSERGLTKIAKVQSELLKWLTGEYHVPSKESVPVPPGFLGHWASDQLELVRIYLSNIPPGAMEADDWSLAIDYLVQRYMPPSTMLEEGEWLATKANLLGRAQAHLQTISGEAAASLVGALPSTIAQATKMFAYSDAQRAILTYGREVCCDSIQSLSETMRHRIKRVVLDHQTRKFSGEALTDGQLESALFDKFDALNRDWRRIAVTEAGEMANQGVIAHLAPGATVRRLEMYNGSCGFCRSIDGRLYRVTTVDDPKKDGASDVWPGKTNLGRSAAPSKRVGGALVLRSPDERFWAAAGVQHPHCRGRWEPLSEPRPEDDKKFAAWLQRRFKETRPDG